MQSFKEVQLSGITRQDIQDLFERAVKVIPGKSRLLFLDVNYLYTFDESDSEYITKLNLLGRYDPKLAIEWHRLLERWFGDQTVVGFGREIKPLQIERTFDRIVNEGLEMIAACICGTDSPTFNYRSIGDGTVPKVYPSDKILVDEVDRINVNTTSNGGSLSRDGATIYSIGNHSKSIPTANLTECGIQSTEDPSTDIMLDHSAFAAPVTHIQNDDAPGSTTVIYMCSA